MTGKHDKKADDEQSANLLLTGPIVIRGLGRSVKDALLPGRPSRHRALRTGTDGVAEDEAAAAPLMLGNDPAADSSGVSVTQIEDPVRPVVHDGAGVEADADGSGKDPVDDRRGAAPVGSEVEQQGQMSEGPDEAVPDVEIVDGYIGDVPTEIDYATAPADGVAVMGSVQGEQSSSPEETSDVEFQPDEPDEDDIFDATESKERAEQDAERSADDQSEQGSGAVAAPHLATDAKTAADVPDNSPTSGEPDAPDVEQPTDTAEAGGGVDEAGAGEKPVNDRSTSGSVEPSAADLGKDVQSEPDASGTEDVSDAVVPVPPIEAMADLDSMPALEASRKTEDQESRHDDDVMNEHEGVTPEGAVRAEKPADTGPAAPALGSGAPPASDEIQPSPERAAESAVAEPESSRDRRSPEQPVVQRDWTTAEQLFSGARPDQQTGSSETPAAAIGDFEILPDALHDTVGVEPEVDPDETGSKEAEPSAAIAPASAFPAAIPSVVHSPRAPATGARGGSRPPRRPRPMRERFGREAIGIAVLVVLALVCGGLITAVVFKTRNDAATAAQEAADYTPPPLATPEPTSTGPVVAVIGDGTTSTAASGVTAAQRWSRLVASSLSGTVDTAASAGMGYAAKSSAGETFVTAARKIPSDAQVVVFFGGAADVDISTLSLAKAATNAYSTASDQAPDAKILVVGPVIAAGASDADLITIRNTLQGSAGIAKASWIDPIRSKWFSAGSRSATATDLTASDEKTLAVKMASAIRAALK